MGLFYNPPQPTQATIHAPIAAQGQQPPPYRPIAAFMVAASLAWTPAPPTLQGSRNIASLIPPAAASQPIPTSTALMLSIRGIWDSQQSWNSQHAAPVAPLTLVYGQQPPISQAARFYENALATPPLTWAAQSENNNAGWNSTAAVVNNPPGILNPQGAALAALSWAVAWPAQSESDTAALNATVIVPANPPPANYIPAAALLGWQPSWNSQQSARSAAWDPGAPALGPQPIAQQSAAASIAWTLSWGAQSASTGLAPTTIVYGQQPPTYSVALQMAIALATPAPSWNSQTAPPNAGWNVPAIVNAPPSVGPTTPLSALLAWSATYLAQTYAPNAAWNFPAPVVSQPTPISIAGLIAIRSAWPQDAWNTQRAPWLAPLTLTYGQQPPSYSIAVLAGIRSAWDSAPAWSAQSEFDNAGWNVALAPAQVPPPSTALLASIVSTWNVAPFWAAQSEFDNAGWNSAAAAPSQTPFVQQPTAQLAALWSVQWSSQRAAPVAGIVPPPIVNNPPLFSRVTLATTISTWPPLWYKSQSGAVLASVLAKSAAISWVTPNLLGPTDGRFSALTDLSTKTTILEESDSRFTQLAARDLFKLT